MKSITAIIKPYKSQLQTADYSKLDSADSWLIEKWQHRIPKGWYGFDGINELWGKIIDEVLVELEKVAPDFEIHQIKLKFGGLRFYVTTNLKDSKTYNKIEKEIERLEELLFSTSLIY